MIPIKLDISAFGPYPNSVSIDFEQFRNRGMFLVSGKTGSGKTMIFDAIMFALYGKTSGSLRKTGNLRCDFSSNDIETYVELTFMYFDKEYTIKRNPTYYKEGRKTPISHNARLICPDGKIIEGATDVDLYLSRLFIINDKQFRQIAMIAQGEFSKVIHASTEDREIILRSLFSTQHYEVQATLLKQKVKEYHDKAIVFNSKKEQLEKNIEADFDEVLLTKERNILNELVSNLKNDRDNINKEIVITEKDNKEILTYNDLLTERTEHLQSKKQFVDLSHKIKILDQCIQIQPLYNQLNQDKIKLQEYNLFIKQKEQEYVEKKSSFEKVKLQYNNKDTQLLEVKKLEQVEHDYITKIEQYSHYVALCKESTMYQEKKHILKQKIQSTESQYSELKTKVDKEVLLKNELPILQKDKITNMNLMDKNNSILEDYNEFYKIEINFKDALINKQNLEETFIEKEKKYIEANQYELELEKNYLYNQAGIIASTLKDDVPCPVCGSTNHPSLAKMQNEIKIESVEQAKEKTVYCRKEKDSSYQSFIESKSLYDTISKQFEDYKKRIETYSSFNEIEIQVNSLKDILKDIDTKLSTYDEERYNQFIIDLKDLDNSLTNLTNEFTLINEQIANVDGKLDGFKDYDKIDINEVILDQKANLQTLNLLLQQIEMIDKQFNQSSNDLNVLANTIESNNKSILEIKESIIKLEKTINDKFSLGNLSIELYEKYNSEINQLESYKIDLERYNNNTVTLEANIQLLKSSVEGKVLKDISIVQEQLKELDLKLEIEEQKKNSLVERINNHLKFKDELVKLENENNVLLQQLEIYNDLKDMFIGNNNQKLSFERYVLASYFDQILIFANMYLSKMSQNRYSLQRRDEIQSKVGKQGLDLDVFDCQTGTYRDVSTLSGGESFKAALALALGMSEMIQSSCGSIAIQTVFIDEGFGTLDSESLDQAMHCLMEVQSGDKLVGIISHVDELKSRISNQIMIEKNDNISEIKICLD